MSETTLVDSATVERLLTTPAYHRWLGLELVRAAPGEVEIALQCRGELTADVDGSYVHGGILATLLDVAGDFALVTELGVGLPTIDLRVDYLRPARPTDRLLAVGTVVRKGRSLGVADAVVTNGDGKKLAVARGLYSTAVASA
ncbi:PaaI family thioesterase [Ruania suaedae]|uniref:PaaI family thioesterase n=1 Tax=Ruania suaedae TaxID=2897774 RepID=UPI001E34B361|nr:PaaI family thioesterase [Ruania suaedae]UFU02818.1 PaaI family thioesterase [Ruania suaedae]